MRALRLGVVAVALGAVVLLPSLQDQLESSRERTISGRATENLVAVAMFADHPVTGVGPERYPALYRDYTRRVGNDDRPVRAAHSLPLQIAAEQGIGGLLGWLTAILLVGMWVVRRGVWHHPVGRALLLSIGVFLVGSLFLHGSLLRLLFMLVGAVVALGWIAPRARPAAAGAVA
jgi:O-Antigen ligase